MKISVKLAKGAITVGEKRASLLSGTFHYWRVQPEAWEQILTSMKEMGLETIETYIAWEYHEISPGNFDFTGQTDSRRNLVHFLELVKQMNLWLVIRPGPYIYSEWVNMGVPGDVLPYHRLRPEFTDRAASYMKEVSKVLVPYLATNGGNIILFQPDNEVDTFEQIYDDQLGLGETPGEFQEFLKVKYHNNIHGLNAYWGTDYSSFEESRALMAEADVTAEYYNRYLDFLAYRADYINRVIAYYAQEYRKLGIDVPMSANAYDIVNVQDFQALEKVVDIVGLDSYPPNEFTGKFSPKGEDYNHRRLNEVFRYLRTFSRCSYLSEFQAGIAHGLHYWAGVMTPNHFMMAGLTAMQAGIQAWNWFMIVNHENWMMSPINEWGRKQGEMFSAFSEVVHLYKEIDAATLDRVTNTSVAFHLKHQCSKAILDDPTLSAIYQAGIDFEFFNFASGNIRKSVLLYSGLRNLAAAEQTKLLHYVEDGGNLVLFDTLPVYDEDNVHKTNILGLVKPDGMMDVPFLDHLASELLVDLKGEKILARAPFLFYHQDTPGEPIFSKPVDTVRIWDTAFEENRKIRGLMFEKRYKVGYHEKRGKGTITVVSLKPTPELITSLLNYLGIVIPIRSQSSSIKVSLHKGNNAFYAILINVGKKEIYAPIEITMSALGNGSYDVRNLRPEISELDSAGFSQGKLSIKLPGKNGTILEIKPTK